MGPRGPAAPIPASLSGPPPRLVAVGVAFLWDGRRFEYPRRTDRPPRWPDGTDDIATDVISDAVGAVVVALRGPTTGTVSPRSSADASNPARAFSPRPGGLTRRGWGRTGR
ncbi:hypothetical protein ACFQL4_09905 [Halosimplex aquaticum]